MDTLSAQQPESYWQILTRSFYLYRHAFSRVIALSLLISFLVFIPRLLSDLIGLDIFAKFPAFSIHRLWLFAISIVSLMFYIALLWRMHCLIEGIHEPIKEDYSRGFKRLLAAFIASVIQSVIAGATLLIAIGFTLLLHHYHLLFFKSTLGIIYTTIIFCLQFAIIVYINILVIFYLPLIAVENRGILASLSHCITIVKGNWWRVFSVQITPWLIYLLLVLLIKFVFNIDLHIFFIEDSSHSLKDSVFNLLIFTLFLPWTAALLLLQANDLELRKR
jgi:hypothetical protein